MPERFNLTYIGEDGKEHRAFVVHRSSIGAIERFTAFLIEHYAGAFPLWLSPVQAAVLPVSEKHESAARAALAALQTAGIRAELSDPNESLGKRVREVKLKKIPYWLVIGDTEASSNAATLESRSGEKQKLPVDKIVSKLKGEIGSKA